MASHFENAKVYLIIDESLIVHIEIRYTTVPKAIYSPFGKQKSSTVEEICLPTTPRQTFSTIIGCEGLEKDPVCWLKAVFGRFVEKPYLGSTGCRPRLGMGKTKGG